MLCLSFWTCAALDLGPSSVLSCLGQLFIGANIWGKRILWMALLCLSSRPSPVLTCLWTSHQKNPPPAFFRAAPKEMSCMPMAWGSSGFHTCTAHRHTKMCCSQPSAEMELYVHTEIPVHIEISAAFSEEQPQDGFSCIYMHLADSPSLPVLPPIVTKTHSHPCSPPCRCTLSKQSTV